MYPTLILHCTAPYGRRLLSILLSALLLLTVHSQATAATKPNVIMVFTDDMGYSDISSFADVDLQVTTPNIDRLATEGTKFTHFYVSMPICTPSRAAVLSGRFAPETCMTNFLEFRDQNSGSDQNDYMEPRLSYLPKSFQQAGYATGHIGKWHLGGGRDVDNAPSIRRYGYDEAYSTWESPNPDPLLGVKNTPWSTTTEPGQVVRHRRTEYMVDKTLDFLQRHQDQPCFITLWPDDLHTPFRPSAAMIAKYGGDPTNDTLRANFYGVLEEYDRQIGRLLDGLAAQGIANDTIIFFTGDNGPAPDYGRDRTNGMNGNKLSLYEGGIRQPFLIRWPGHIPAGATNSQTVLHAVDLLPTLCGLAGIPMHAEGAANTDGENLAAAMLGSTPTRTKPLYWEYGRTAEVPRPGVNDVDRSPILATREGDYMLLLNPDGTETELYNVRTDPRQDTNIADSMPALVTSMKTKVFAWHSQLPHRSQPYPVFGTVAYNQYVISEVATASALRTAAGAATTARVDAVAVAPNGTDDVFAIHTDSAGEFSIIRINEDESTVTEVIDSATLRTQLGLAPATPLPLVAGFDFSPPGDRLFLASQLGGLPAILGVNVATSTSTIVSNNANLTGLSDHGVLANGEIAGVRGSSGNRTVGTVLPYSGAWTQRVSETQLKTAAPGTSQIIPEAISASSTSNEVHIFSHLDRELFRVADVMAGTPSITRLTSNIPVPAHFHDVAVDQAGNLYGLDSTNAQIVVVRRSDTSQQVVPLSQVATQLGGGFSVTEWRGLAARIIDPTHADLYLASANPQYGVVRIRFGVSNSSVGDWMLH